MKQTAVKYLLERICNDILDDDFINKLSNEKTQLFYYISKEAKEMEKEQIIDAANQIEFEDEDGFGISENITKGEQYYNETYGSKGSDETKTDKI